MWTLLLCSPRDLWRRPSHLQESHSSGDNSGISFCPRRSYIAFFRVLCSRGFILPRSRTCLSVPFPPCPQIFPPRESLRLFFSFFPGFRHRTKAFTPPSPHQVWLRLSLGVLSQDPLVTPFPFAYLPPLPNLPLRSLFLLCRRSVFCSQYSSSGLPSWDDFPILSSLNVFFGERDEFSFPPF